jgi:heme-degrading monooxygenase HmoA
MIARIWHGWTKPENAKAYEDMLRDEIFPGIARRNIKGYRGAELFIHEDGNEIEFVTLLRFDSMEAVKEFAGMDESKPVISEGRSAPYPNGRTLAPLPNCQFSLRNCKAGAPACHLIGKRERLPYSAAAAKLTMRWELHPNCDVC